MQGALDRPRFRQDLVAELVEDGNKRFIDVADPDNGQVFRFYEVEYSLACAMDGERDVAGIVRWAKEELGLTANPNEVKSVIATLGDLGYLESAAAAAAAARPIEKPAAVGRKPTPPAMNRWDQPTAMGESDQYLEKGVVAAKPAAHAPIDDVELGRAGAKVAVAEMPKAPELELGAPGAARASQPKMVAASEIPLGSSGRAPDVSVDLSDGMAVKPDDVKEAVRASQVMRAPSVPQELLDSVAPTITEKPPEKADKPREKPVEAKKPEPTHARPAEPRPTPQPRASIDSPAPRPAAEPARPKTPSKAPPAPRSGVSPILLILLVIVVVGAGAFVAYKFILKKSDETAQSTQPPPSPAIQPTKPPEPPPPPPVETEKLATEQPAVQELKAPAAGQLETIAANDATVKAGDVVFALAGHKPIETAMANVSRDIDKRLQPDVAKAEHDRDAAEQAGNKPGVTAAEKRIETANKALEDAQRKVAAMTTDLGKLVVKASVEGKVTQVAKANARVTPNDVVAKLAPGPVLVATFKTTTPPVSTDARVLLAVKGGEQKLSCKVVDASNGTKIACPHDAAAEGTEVTFAGIDNSPPPEAPKPEPAGSAAPPKAAPPPPEPTRPAPARVIRPPNRPVLPKPPQPTGSDKPADKPPEDQPAPAPAGSAAP